MNLLPTEENRLMHRDYFLRFLAMVGVIFVAASLIGITMLVAPYVAVQSKNMTLHSEIKNMTNTTTAQKLGDLQKTIDISAAKISALMPRTNILFTDVVGKIVGERPSGVTVNAFSYQVKDEKTVTVTLQGVGNNRNAILQFIQNLQREKDFSDVSVPVSNFAKNTDADFSLSLTAHIE